MIELLNDLRSINDSISEEYFRLLKENRQLRNTIEKSNGSIKEEKSVEDMDDDDLITIRAGRLKQLLEMESMYEDLW